MGLAKLTGFIPLSSNWHSWKDAVRWNLSPIRISSAVETHHLYFFKVPPTTKKNKGNSQKTQKDRLIYTNCVSSKTQNGWKFQLNPGTSSMQLATLSRWRNRWWLDGTVQGEDCLACQLVCCKSGENDKLASWSFLSEEEKSANLSTWGVGRFSKIDGFLKRAWWVCSISARIKHLVIHGYTKGHHFKKSPDSDFFFASWGLRIPSYRKAPHPTAWICSVQAPNPREENLWVEIWHLGFHRTPKQVTIGWS